MNIIGRRALALIAVLGLGLGACSATVPETQGPAASDDTAVAGAGGVGAAPAAVRVLNLQDVSATLADSDDLEVHVTVNVIGMGETLPAMSFTSTTDSANGRFAYQSEPVDVSDLAQGDDPTTVPGYEVIGQQGAHGSDLYVRASDDQDWVHLEIDESLTGETEVFSNPGQVLDAFDLTDTPGLTFTEDGTGTHNGSTMVRQVANLDFLDMLDEAMPAASADGSDEFAEMFEEMLSSEELGAFLPSGTIELLVDGDSKPRQVTIDLSIGGAQGAGDAFSGSMSSVMTIDPAPAGGIDLPGAGEIAETVTVDSYGDFIDALGTLGPALAWN